MFDKGQVSRLWSESNFESISVWLFPLLLISKFYQTTVAYLHNMLIWRIFLLFHFFNISPSNLGDLFIKEAIMIWWETKSQKEKSVKLWLEVNHIPFLNKKSNVMENFTDLFGDDLTGLDGLGDLGNFGGANTGAPGGPPANAPQVHT